MYKEFIAGIEIAAEMLMNISVFYDVSLCIPVEVNRRFALKMEVVRYFEPSLNYTGLHCATARKIVPIKKAAKNGFEEFKAQRFLFYSICYAFLGWGIRTVHKHSTFAAVCTVQQANGKSNQILSPCDCGGFIASISNMLYSSPSIITYLWS
jgi:hypothetical protein